MRFWLLAIGAGLTSALLYGSIISTNGWGGSPVSLLLVYFAQLPLMLAGLSLGPIAGMVASTTGVIALFLLGSAMISGGFAIGTALPSVLVSRQALLMRSPSPERTEWYPLGSVLGWLVLWAGTITSIALILLLGQNENFYTDLQDMIGRILLQMVPQVSGAERDNLAETLAKILPGIIALSWLTMTVINACLAQSIAKKLHINTRPSADIVTLQLPRWLLVALPTAAFLGLWGNDMGYVAQNLLLVLLLPLFLVGLAVIHVFARNRQNFRSLILGFSYALILIIGWPAILVAGIGLVDQLVGLRQRMTDLA